MYYLARLSFSLEKSPCAASYASSPTPVITACDAEESSAVLTVRKPQHFLDKFSVFFCQFCYCIRSDLLRPSKARLHQCWIVGYEDRVINAWLGIAPGRQTVIARPCGPFPSMRHCPCWHAELIVEVQDLLNAPDCPCRICLSAKKFEVPSCPSRALLTTLTERYTELSTGYEALVCGTRRLRRRDVCRSQI